MNTWIGVTGWTLVHFVWQGGLIGVAAASVLWLLRAGSSRTRYAVGCASLGAMLTAPVITARLLLASAPSVPAGALLQSELPAAVVLDDRSPQPEATASHPIAGDAMRLRVDRWLPVVVVLWLAGVALFLLRLVGGWWRVRRLHRTALARAASIWQGAGERMASELRLRRVVWVIDSCLVDTPTVVGWLRPAILLPVAALANLTPAQVDAILAHELAHVRRHDFVVNLLQTVAETLLFYHPAVWWISTRIRAEREHCCDDVAVKACGDPVEYVSALAELETWRTARTGPLALAATSGSLLDRVRRLLRVPGDDERPAAQAVVTAGLVLLFIAASGGMQRLASGKASTQAPAKRNQALPAATDQAEPDLPPALARLELPPPLPPTPAQTPWFDRKFYATDHFEIYFTPELEIQLDRIGREAERAYRQISADLRHNLGYSPRLILFTTRADLDRGRLAAGTGEGRSDPRPRVLLSVDVDAPSGRLHGDLVHEITHTFEADIVPPSIIHMAPRWISEGLAQYERGEWNASDRATLGDLVRTNTVPRMSQLRPSSFAGNPRVNDALGHAAFEFIGSRWDKDGAPRFLAALRQSARGDVSNVYRAAFGLAPDDFDREFDAYVRARFQSAAAGTKPPAFEVASAKPIRSGDPQSVRANSRQAADPFVGRWKLNLAQSRLLPTRPGMAATEETFVIQETSERYEVIETATLENGQPFVLRYSTPIKGGPVTYSYELALLGSVAMKRVSDRALNLISTLYGKAIQTGHFTVSGDGKTMRNDIKGINALGEPVQGLELWDKQ